MGLDMYLMRRVYLANYSHAKKEQKLANAVMDALGIDKKEMYKDTSLNIELCTAYWRKANAIHGWFVKHVQNGKDDCGEYYVTREQLEELRTLCKDILDGRKPKDEMPPTEGFFFGPTDSPEYYRQDLEDTIKKITDTLEAPDIAHDSFYYTSSW